MKAYTLYFELFGKKMKTTIKAKSREDAIRVIKDSIIFHKVEALPDENLKNLFDIFGFK
jgi:two-component SAPR family response regulator